MCSVYFHQATIGKSNQKNWKNTIILVFEKVIQLVARALVTVRKKDKSSKSIITTLTYFENLKKKQQDQGGKNGCYTESFMPVTISNLRTTAFCFENTKLSK